MSDEKDRPGVRTAAQPGVQASGDATPTGENSSAPGRVARLVVLVLLGLILADQLLIPPVVGLADQSDFGRLFQPFGIRSDISDPGRRYFGYFIRTWKIEKDTASLTGFFPPDMAFVAASLSLNSVLSKPGLYDIRCLAFVRMALFLAAAALLLQSAWRRGLLVRAVTVFALVVVFGDVGYVAYFNSAYCEPSSFLFGLLAIAFYLRIAASEGSPASNLAGFAFCGAMLVWSKPQNILVGLVLGVAALRLGQASRNRSWRIGTRLAALGLVACSALYRVLPPPDWYREHIRYIAIFTRMLPSSPDSRRDLKELGLDPALATLAGTYPWGKEAGDRPEQLRQLFYSRIGDAALARFYLRHPERVWTLLRASGPRALWLRSRLGNFEESTGGKPLGYAQSFAWRSNFVRRYGPNRIGSLAIWLGGAVILAAAFWLRAPRPGRLAYEGIALLVATALTQYVPVVLLQGPDDVEKGMFLFAFYFDACVVGAVALVADRADTLLSRCQWRYGRTPVGAGPAHDHGTTVETALRASSVESIVSGPDASATHTNERRIRNQ